ncbi:MAG: gamma-butyrobetaine hydroxylase-like domain-containing protein [Ignavibacteriaceae bacterium]
MVPKSIKVKEKKFLQITWEDESQSKISLKYLRDECPCATCKGETVLLKTTILFYDFEKATPILFFTSNQKISRDRK